ncbi:hypothetical protein [Lentzea sp. NPDC051838]|uniref:hypothetical protein n=1 Tax=Lentzea sp. NPDC051838 TaxID=3154849 RepID=UPI00342D1D74
MLGYELLFPSSLDTKQTKNVMRILAGRPYGSKPIGFELWSMAKGFTYRLRVPRVEAPAIVQQLRALVPGINVTPEHQPPTHMWTDVLELGDSARGRTLSVDSPEAVTAAVLASLQVEDDEALMIQLVVAPPMRPFVAPVESTPPRTGNKGVNFLLHRLATSKEEITDRQTKLKTANVEGVLRVAVRAASPERAGRLLMAVTSVLGSLRGGSSLTPLRRSPEERFDLLARLVDGSSLNPNPLQLNEDELAAVVAWPVGSPVVPGVPQSRSRQLPIHPSVAATGIVVGHSNVPGRERSAALTEHAMTMGMAFFGPIGTGKTVAEANVFAQFVARGGGALLIETKGDRGDLFHWALNLIPEHRVKDCIVLDVTDADWPVGFNVLEQGNPQAVASGLDALFQEIYGHLGVRMPAALYHGVMTAMTTTKAEQPLTLADLPILYAPRTEGERSYAARLVEGTPDEEIRRWWQLVDGQYSTVERRTAFFEPVLQRLWQVNGRRELRNVFGQSVSSFNLRDAVATNKIVLVNLAGLGSQVKNLLGSVLVDLFWGAIKARAARRPYALFLDEYQNLPVFALDTGVQMLREGRAFNLCSVLGTHGPTELNPKLAETVMLNSLSKFSFQTDSSNARAIVREFGRFTTEEDVLNLGRHEVVARLMGSDGVSPPMTLRMCPPPNALGSAHMVRLFSRQAYGREVAAVEAAIGARRGGNDQRPPRPTVGEAVW